MACDEQSILATARKLLLRVMRSDHEFWRRYSDFIAQAMAFVRTNIRILMRLPAVSSEEHSDANVMMLEVDCTTRFTGHVRASYRNRPSRSVLHDTCEMSVRNSALNKYYTYYVTSFLA